MAALQREGTAVSHCKHPAICACRQHQRSLRWKPLKATWLLNAYPAAAAVACRRQRSPVTSAEQLQHSCFVGGITMQRNYPQAPHVSLHESLMYPARRSQHHLSFNHFVVTLHSRFAAELSSTAKPQFPSPVLHMPLSLWPLHICSLIRSSQSSTSALLGADSSV